MAQRLDVLGIGNAIVDVIARVDDEFLGEIGIYEDSMRLIDQNEAADLYSRMGPGREVSGGSAANSIAAIAMLGGQAGYVGKVRNDQLGSVFAHDIRSVGVEFDSAPSTDGEATACCLILVPPSGKRAMNTYLGAALNLRPEDLDAKQIAEAQVTLIEGYAWTSDMLRATSQAAMQACHRFGNKVAFTLAADWIAGNPYFELPKVVRGHVDILFANEAEVKALTGAPDFDSAVHSARGMCETLILTRGEKGAVVLTEDGDVVIAAAPIDRVVDTTGAGDLFAGGMLYGLTNGLDVATSGRLGALCAAEVISQIGARPMTDMKSLIEKARAA
jgi:sugar/nucleoside kinase (ribokinase family)